MKRIFALAVFLLSLLAPLATITPASAANCQFVLGFKALHDLIPDVVGDCLEDEHFNMANGDSLQMTTKGLLVWRKLDNWTAMTDGYRTWVNGPDSIQERLNSERYCWEGDAGAKLADGMCGIATPMYCPQQPISALTAVLQANPDVASRLGCATSTGATAQLAWQPFQGGQMLWRSDSLTILTLMNGAGWANYPDTYSPGDSLPIIASPPGFFSPINGFGKIWQQQPGLREQLGWGAKAEHGMWGGVQNFSNGLVVWTTFDNYTGSPSQNVYVLYTNGGWWEQNSPNLAPSSTCTNPIGLDQKVAALTALERDELYLLPPLSIAGGGWSHWAFWIQGAQPITPGFSYQDVIAARQVIWNQGLVIGIPGNIEGAPELAPGVTDALAWYAVCH